MGTDERWLKRLAAKKGNGAVIFFFGRYLSFFKVWNQKGLVIESRLHDRQI